MRSDEHRWFVRLAPRWALLLMLPAVGVGMGCGLAVAMATHTLLESQGVLPALQATFGEGAIYGGLSVPYVLGGVVGGGALLVWQGRRYSVCGIGPSGLTLLSGYSPPPEVAPALDAGVGEHVPLEHVQSWQRTRHGLLLRIEGQGGLRRFLFPALVPIQDAEELALAEELLGARRRPGSGADEASQASS